MRTAPKPWLALLFVVGALLACTSCRVVPSVSMGVGFDYYGGGFHPRPYGNVGIRGYP